LFNDHYQAYCVDSNDADRDEIINYNAIPKYPPCTYVKKRRWWLYCGQISFCIKHCLV